MHAHTCTHTHAWTHTCTHAHTHLLGVSSLVHLPPHVAELVYPFLSNQLLNTGALLLVKLLTLAQEEGKERGVEHLFLSSLQIGRAHV